MTGTSQGKGLPGIGSTPPDNISSKNHSPSLRAKNAVAFQSHADQQHSRSGGFRCRVAVADARRVQLRVQSHAATLGLGGARKQVLLAVLELLCGWKRLSDDQIRLTQLVNLCANHSGHRYDLKTIGRALRALHAAELITYEAARGRGNHATIAIHTQFSAGIAILDRDAKGRVITTRKHSAARQSVTFSATPYKEKISKKKYLPPTPTATKRPHTTRPVTVDVSAHDVRQVLHQLPTPLNTLARTQRWMLGAAIKRQLARGYLPAQILAILHAPLPDHLDRPCGLALWRLSHNMPGAGPRLLPLQQAWDRDHASAARTAAQQTTASWYGQVLAATTAEQRFDVLRADELYFGRPATDVAAVLAGAARRARRLFPQLPLADGLTRWVHEVLDRPPTTAAHNHTPPVSSLSRDLLINATIGASACIACNAPNATPRPQLPLRSPVCDHCWTTTQNGHA